MSSLYSFATSSAIDSQVTLVDTSTFGTPHTIISFIRDDMKNTNILNASEQPLYSITTDALTNAYTTFIRLPGHSASVSAPGIGVREGDASMNNPEVVAILKRKDLREDRIKFAGSDKSIKLSKWLHGPNGKWTDLYVESSLAPTS